MARKYPQEAGYGDETPPRGMIKPQQKQLKRTAQKQTKRKTKR